MQKFMDAVLLVVKGLEQRFEARLKALEGREIVHGKDGAPGPPGARGERGEKGIDGLPGDSRPAR
jgi:hypothetical protein